MYTKLLKMIVRLKRRNWGHCQGDGDETGSQSSEFGHCC